MSDTSSSEQIVTTFAQPVVTGGSYQTLQLYHPSTGELASTAAVTHTAATFSHTLPYILDTPSLSLSSNTNRVEDVMRVITEMTSTKETLDLRTNDVAASISSKSNELIDLGAAEEELKATVDSTTNRVNTEEAFMQLLETRSTYRKEFLNNSILSTSNPASLKSRIVVAEEVAAEDTRRIESLRSRSNAATSNASYNKTSLTLLEAQITALDIVITGGEDKSTGLTEKVAELEQKVKTVIVERAPKIAKLNSDMTSVVDTNASVYENTRLKLEGVANHQTTSQTLHENMRTDVDTLVTTISQKKSQHEADLKVLKDAVSLMDERLVTIMSSFQQKYDAFWDLRSALIQSSPSTTFASIVQGYTASDSQLLATLGMMEKEVASLQEVFKATFVPATGSLDQV